jgi:hypothetical protein
LYHEAKKAGKFIDSEFPPDNSSIGDSSNLNYDNFTKNTVWLRPR